MTVTKAELTREIVEAAGLTQREAKEMAAAQHTSDPIQLSHHHSDVSELFWNLAYTSLKVL